MKKKYDKFMEDMNLREEAWAYEKAEFDRAANNDAYYEKGRAEGEMEKAKSQAIKFYQKKYPGSDIQWMDSLTGKQYDEIFERLLNDESLEDLKE